MNTLPPIAGLLKLSAAKADQAGWCMNHARSEKSDPRLAHESEVQAQKLTTEAQAALDHARGNAEMILNIETLIHYLEHSPIKSAGRTLALRHLEDASMRLRREIGDEPGKN